MMVQVVSHVRKIQPWKIEEVEYLAKLFKEYPVFLIASIERVPAKHLQNLRKSFKDRMLFRVSKNKLILKAMEKAGIDTKSFENVLVGQNIIVFTKMNVFEAANLIEQCKTLDYYKPGEVADKEIVVPEGNTGIPPGPMLSVFGKLKIPTRVEGNTIVIARDTVVAKPGDVISPELASLLQKLDLKLKEITLKIKVGYDRGLLIPGDELKLNIGEYEQLLVKAVSEAKTLAVEIVWPEPEILQVTLVKAYLQARALAIDSCFIAPDTVKDLIAAAQAKALALAVELSKQGIDLGVSIQVQQQPVKPAEEKRVEEKKEEREEEKTALSEEELGAGLEALFG